LLALIFLSAGLLAIFVLAGHDCFDCTQNPAGCPYLAKFSELSQFALAVGTFAVLAILMAAFCRNLKESYARTNAGCKMRMNN